MLAQKIQIRSGPHRYKHKRIALLQIRSLLVAGR
jgi:hypothetical protein